MLCYVLSHTKDVSIETGGGHRIKDSKNDSISTVEFGCAASVPGTGGGIATLETMVKPLYRPSLILWGNIAGHTTQDEGNMILQFGYS